MGQMGAQKLSPRGFPSRTHGAAAPGGFYLNSLLLEKKKNLNNSRLPPIFSPKGRALPSGSF